MERITPENVQIVLLGTGTPNADPARSGPSIAIVVNDSPYLVDFGPGVIRRAAAAYELKNIQGLKPEKLTRAFLTHLHSDHTAGYPDLIFTPWVLERKMPLHVYGPVGLFEMTNNILKAYQSDIDERLNGLEPANPSGYETIPFEIGPGLIYEDNNVKVEAFAVNHGSWCAMGYRFKIDQFSIVISGDTAPFPSMTDLYKDCNILIHEVYSGQGLQTRPADWKKYHTNVHTSAYELGKVAEEIKPELLILYHQLFWGCSEKSLIAEIKTKYSGSVVSGNDLDIY